MTITPGGQGPRACPPAMGTDRSPRSSRPLFAALLLALGLVAGCTSGDAESRRRIAPRADRPTQTPPDTTSVPPVRDPAQWPFASTSPWNTPLGSGARFDNSADPCSASLTTETVTPTVNAVFWSITVAQTTDSDPLTTLSVRGIPQTEIHSPTDARPSDPQVEQGGDAALLVIDPARSYVDELWRTRRVVGGWDALRHVRNDLRGSGVGDGGIRAYGGSALGGLIRRSELQAGHIPHPLALALTRSQLLQGFVWPASSEDTSDPANPYRGAVPMGMLVAIPPLVNLAALDLTPQGLAIARALQDYGAYVVDASETLALYAEPSAEDLADIARTDLPQIRGLLRCVVNNGPDNVGGGGIPRRPLAPPLEAEDPAGGQT